MASSVSTNELPGRNTAATLQNIAVVQYTAKRGKELLAMMMCRCRMGISQRAASGTL